MFFLLFLARCLFSAACGLRSLRRGPLERTEEKVLGRRTSETSSFKPKQPDTEPRRPAVHLGKTAEKQKEQPICRSTVIKRTYKLENRGDGSNHVIQTWTFKCPGWRSLSGVGASIGDPFEGAGIQLCSSWSCVGFNSRRQRSPVHMVDRSKHHVPKTRQVSLMVILIGVGHTSSHYSTR